MISKLEGEREWTPTAETGKDADLTLSSLSKDLDGLSEFLQHCQMTGDSSRNAILGQINAIRTKYGLEDNTPAPDEAELLARAMDKAYAISNWKIGTLDEKRRRIREILGPHLRTRRNEDGNKSS